MVCVLGTAVGHYFVKCHFQGWQIFLLSLLLLGLLLLILPFTLLLVIFLLVLLRLYFLHIILCLHWSDQLAYFFPVGDDGVHGEIGRGRETVSRPHSGLCIIVELMSSQQT
jgi:hypothetical protein